MLLVLSILSTTAIAQNTEFISRGKAFNGPDRTITWRPWQQSAKDEFRFRTGDRYLGRAVWEHYLGFEQNRSSSKAIKLSMIRLGNEDVGRGRRSTTGFALRNFQGYEQCNDCPQRSLELDRARGPLNATVV